MTAVVSGETLNKAFQCRENFEKFILLYIEYLDHLMIMTRYNPMYEITFERYLLENGKITLL